jgi:hypothetical protein
VKKSRIIAGEELFHFSRAKIYAGNNVRKKLGPSVESSAALGERSLVSVSERAFFQCNE